MIWRIPLIWFLLIHLISNQNSGTPITFINQVFAYSYGEVASFQVTIETNAQIQKLFLILKPEGQDSRTVEVSFPSNLNITFQYDLQAHPLPPYSHVDYWYLVELQDKQTVESPHSTFYYEDNRFDWQTLTGEDQFQIYWYAGDIQFGQLALNTAQNALKTSASYIQVSPPKPIRIYIYSSAQDLQSTIQLGRLNWIAGQAIPALGVILVSIPSGPEQRYELERQIPHEIMHILQYQLVGPEGYSHEPLWLLEGMASVAEFYPNPDYEQIRTQAAQNDNLLPMASLCNSFPREASGAFLAYAQSNSFVQFLSQKYGNQALVNLLIEYKGGIDCSPGFFNTLGITLNQAEVTWRQESLGLDAFWLAIKNLFPFFLLVIILICVPLMAVYLQPRKIQPEKNEAKP